MKIFLIILAVVAVVAITAILVLRHPAFGRRMSEERKARIEAVFTVHHDKFALAKHPWYEPEQLVQSFAEKNAVRLLDQPIGTVIYF